MFEEEGLDAKRVFKELDEILEADTSYEAGTPIASMSSIPHRISSRIMAQHVQRNLGRKHTFPGSAKIERKVVQMIGDLVHLANPYGTTTSGGTESNILAMVAARETAQVDKPEIIAPKTVHSSVDKAAWLLGVELIKTSVDSQYRAVPEEIEEAINESTVGIFVTAGTTYLGQIDPIDQIGTIAIDNGLPLHVDAAFGGFVIPFLDDLGLGKHPFGFEVPGVTSVSVDPHKTGLAPIPSGCLLFRKEKHLQAITRNVPYIPFDSKIPTLLGTRPAAPVVATWAIMKHLGREGYQSIVKDCMSVTEFAHERTRENPHLQCAIEPVLNILGITSQRISIDTIVREMEKRGWRMGSSPLPESFRMVIVPHVTEKVVNSFFTDLNEITKSLGTD
ncbi:MAG: tyrosine decarboxylase MfnA [Candidatus Thorarchaeota archaeon]|nr:tyrosine decarboxylase MfnA [Candidatus Thorarchaeota archaeon]